VVYVDDMEAKYRGMTMCHMVADTHSELMAMANLIGMRLRWLQKAGTYKEHFDICKSKRALAVMHGAVEINRAQLGAILASKKNAT
jgi:hypothetical protein